MMKLEDSVFAWSSQTGPILWPKPSHWSSSPQRYRLPPDRSFRIETNRRLRQCDIVQHNLLKYNSIVQSLIDSTVANYGCKSTSQSLANNSNDDKDDNNNPIQLGPILREVYLLIENLNCSSDVYPEFVPNTINGGINSKFNDESYSIEIQPDTGTAILYGTSVWSAVRALETFSQLLYVDTAAIGDSGQDSGNTTNPTTTNNCQHQSAVYVNVSRVFDRPRFVYRSVLIDTARHFVPISIVLDNLASYSKCHIYRPDQIRMVVEEARLRAIQVIVEIDTPAHSQALGRAFPNLLTKCHQNEKNGPATKTTINSKNINPSLKESFQIVKQLLAEIRQLFPSKWIHLGFDDVEYDCWNSSSVILLFMKQNQISTLEQLEQFYLQQIVFDQTGLQGQIVWQDPFDKGVELPTNTIVEVWKDERNSPDSRPWTYYMEQIVKQNRTVILASCWFLNIIRYGQDWKDLYNCDPHDFDGIAEDRKRTLVIGGEACLWGEYVDETNLLARLWPRASAVAERLWSEQIDDQTMEDVQFRLDGQRCRMLQRGIPAQPIQSGYCPDHRWNSEPVENNNAEWNTSGVDLVQATSLEENSNEFVDKQPPDDEVEFNADQSGDNYQSSKRRDIRPSNDYVISYSPCRTLHSDYKTLNGQKLSRSQIVSYEVENDNFKHNHRNYWNLRYGSLNSHSTTRAIPKAFEILISLQVCLSSLVIKFLLKL